MERLTLFQAYAYLGGKTGKSVSMTPEEYKAFQARRRAQAAAGKG